MFFDLIEADSVIWIFLQKFLDKILTGVAESKRQFEVTGLDFLIEFGGYIVLERQVAQHHCVKEDSAGPEIYFFGIVCELVQHFRRCIAGRSAGCLQ